MDNQPASPSPVPDPSRVFDIKPPSSNVPSSTSRPLVVDNQPIQADPMMRPAAEPPVTTTIQPLQDLPPTESQPETPQPTPTTPDPMPSVSLPVTEPSSDETHHQEFSQTVSSIANDINTSQESTPPQPQPQVMNSSVVVVRHRLSRPSGRSFIIVVIALLLIVAAVDVLLDDQIIKTNSIPHTHFFQK